MIFSIASHLVCNFDMTRPFNMTLSIADEHERAMELDPKGMSPISNGFALVI